MLLGGGKAGFADYLGEYILTMKVVKNPICYMALLYCYSHLLLSQCYRVLFTGIKGN